MRGLDFIQRTNKYNAVHLTDYSLLLQTFNSTNYCKLQLLIYYNVCFNMI